MATTAAPGASVPATQEKKNVPIYELQAMAAKAAFVRACGNDDGKWNREVVYALQALRRNDATGEALRKSDPESIKNAMVNVALTGATLNPVMQQAYLVPRDGKCCLDFSYRGLVNICMDAGQVKTIEAQVVYDWDEFDYEQGSDSRIRYRMCLNPPVDMDKFIKEPIKIWDHVVCAYSKSVLHDGTVDFIILPKWKLWKVFQSSKGKDNKKMPWHTWPDEQMRKTAIKYHVKTLPVNERVAKAVQVLNEHEGLDLGKDGDFIEVPVEPVDYNIPADLKEDIDAMCDILDINDAAKNMELGQRRARAKSDEDYIALVAEYRNSLSVLLSRKQQGKA
ncbi:MAG: recombinase RecT [Nitrospiraceae bacterium]|nr:recombinase RecT [Nitrospiraceae bacterium]